MNRGRGNRGGAARGARGGRGGAGGRGGRGRGAAVVRGAPQDAALGRGRGRGGSKARSFSPFHCLFIRSSNAALSCRVVSVCSLLTF